MYLAYLKHKYVEMLNKNYKDISSRVTVFKFTNHVCVRLKLSLYLVLLFSTLPLLYICSPSPFPRAVAFTFH